MYVHVGFYGTYIYIVPFSMCVCVCERCSKKVLVDIGLVDMVQ